MKKKKLLESLVYLIGGALAGSALYYVAEDSIEDLGVIQSFAIFTAAFVASIFLAILIHELGHLVVGSMSGFRFLSFRVGNLVLVRTEKGLEFKIYTVAGTAGQCLMAPPDRWEDMNAKWYLLGGILFNAGTGALAVVSAFQVEGIPRGILFIFGTISLITAITNALPTVAQGASDGGNLVTLKSSLLARCALWTQLAVAEKLSQGVELADMPAEWFDAPWSDVPESTSCVDMDITTCVDLALATKKPMDVLPEVERLLKHENLHPAHENELLMEKMYLHLITEANPDPAVIERILEDVGKTYLKQTEIYPSRQRQNYALARLYRKDEEEAAKVRKKFEEVGKKFSFPGTVSAERKRIEFIDALAADRTKNAEEEIATE